MESSTLTVAAAVTWILAVWHALGWMIWLSFTFDKDKENKMNTDYSIIKYPRTPHIEGSRLQPGDEDLSQIPFDNIAGRHIVIEEKIDGANSALSFNPQGELLLQSRGHYLTGGCRERHYNLFKQWAGIHQPALWETLGCRYVM